MPVRSYRLPARQVSRLSEPGEFWATIHASDLMDEVPELSIGQFGMVSECLMESMIRLPREHESGLSRNPDGNTRVLLCLTRHEARVLHTRLDKHPELTANDQLDIFDAYGYGDAKSPALCQAAIAFLHRQHEHLHTDDDWLVIVGVDATPSSG